MAWIADVVVGFGLVVFIGSAFVLASAMPALLGS